MIFYIYVLIYRCIGTLGPPQNISITGSTQEISTTWEKPMYVLQGIHISIYEVHVNFTCSYENKSSADDSVQAIDANVHDREYTFKPNNTDCNCSNYAISLCINAVTAAGQGATECETKGHTHTLIMLSLPFLGLIHVYINRLLYIA